MLLSIAERSLRELAGQVIESALVVGLCRMCCVMVGGSSSVGSRRESIEEGGRDAVMLADGSSRANHFAAHVAIAERSLNVCSCHGYSDSPSEILGGELRAGSKRSAGRVVVGLLTEGVVEFARSNRVAGGE